MERRCIGNYHQGPCTKTATHDVYRHPETQLWAITAGDLWCEDHASAMATFKNHHILNAINPDEPQL